MIQRIADWHGEQACVYYQKWTRTQHDEDLRDYARHAIIAKRLWNWCHDERYAMRNVR